MSNQYFHVFDVSWSNSGKLKRQLPVASCQLRVASWWIYFASWWINFASWWIKSASWWINFASWLPKCTSCIYLPVDIIPPVGESILPVGNSFRQLVKSPVFCFILTLDKWTEIWIYPREYLEIPLVPRNLTGPHILFKGKFPNRRKRRKSEWK